MSSRSRRAVLATLASVGLAGCTSSNDSDPPTENELPDRCPTSVNLDVTWPRDIYTRSIKGFVAGYESVAEFVKTYEEAYVVEQATDHRFESYSANVELNQTPNKLADGFHVMVTSRKEGGVTDHLDIQAFEVDSDGIPKDRFRIEMDESVVPDDLEYTSVDEIGDQRLQEVLKSAADSGYETGKAATQYIDFIENLPSHVSLNNRQMGAYFDVNRTPVLLIIEKSSSGGAAVDFRESFAQYYVTEYVIRRTEDKDESPQNGRVVECRPPE